MKRRHSRREDAPVFCAPLLRISEEWGRQWVGPPARSPDATDDGKSGREILASACPRRSTERFRPVANLIRSLSSQPGSRGSPGIP